MEWWSGFGGVWNTGRVVEWLWWYWWSGGEAVLVLVEWWRGRGGAGGCGLETVRAVFMPDFPLNTGAPPPLAPVPPLTPSHLTSSASRYDTLTRNPLHPHPHTLYTHTLTPSTPIFHNPNLRGTLPSLLIPSWPWVATGGDGNRSKNPTGDLRL
ncbi:hypothetical protein Pcinc_029678 [Petrolisthes cinctipes]|uniref:Uncharacterized protein n=1 Tax=Petrolisthes cinctipes TaxID=88211 RepID=A0AAE1F0F7_PETCI|nr:hypothetical protein Pcinc_029678 [Petrolisthes cinctipes]